MSTNLGQILKGLLELLVGALATLWDLLTGRGKHDEHYHEHDEQHQLRYFMPGQMMLQIEHPAGMNSSELFSLISQPIEGLAEGKLKPLDPEAILTFPLEINPGRWFSLVRAETTSSEPQDLVTLLLSFYDRLKVEAVEPATNIFIQTASPNWLFGSSSHAPHPNSPGSWPVPAPAPSGDAWKFSLLDQNDTTSAPLPFVNDDGAGVDVAILDTVPARSDRDAAYKKWHAQHKLVEELLNPASSHLHIYEGITPNLQSIESSPVGHGYPMPDHGLFIAGIVHSLAPKAEVHLVEAFSPYGTGTTESIARGILKILDILRKPGEEADWHKTVVCCSFGLASPEEGHDGHTGDENADFPPEFLDPDTRKHMTAFLRTLFSGIAKKEDVLLVAAAGNDSDTNGRKVTRDPAAYEEVLGVGALPAVPLNPSGNYTYRAASYSNHADDKNPDEGYMTFGGEPGPGNGIRGMYISPFPVYKEGCLSFLMRMLTGKGLDGWKGQGYVPPNPLAIMPDQIGSLPNETGWGWWAGTSFATPILAGFLAGRWSGARRGDPLNCANAEDELDQHNRNLGNPEKVLHVHQG